MRGRKKFLTHSLLFLFFLTGIFFLTYKFVIPVLIEQAVEERLSRELGKEVRLGKVDLSLFRGIKFYQLFIYEPGEEKKIFLQVEELQIDYCFHEILDNFREKSKNFQKWQLALKITSLEITFQGWHLENLYLPLRIEDSLLIGEDLDVELYGGSLQGSFSLNLASDPKDYQFEGTLSGLNLNRLAVIAWNAQEEKEAEGILKANFHLQGIVGDWKNISGQGKITSPEITFQGWHLENLYLPLRIEDSLLIGEDLDVELYGGSLQGSFSLNLASDPKDYQFEGTLSGLNLNRLAVIAWNAQEEKEAEGILKANFHLQGTVGDWESLSGQVEASMVEGDLGELPLLGDLMAILPLLSREKVVFRKGEASFTIDEGIVATEDLTLTSEQVKVLIRGKMDFQGYFQPSLVYRVSFSRGFLDEVPLIGDILSFIIDEAGHLIAQVEVTGSLKEPKYRLIPLAKGMRDFLRMFQYARNDN